MATNFNLSPKRRKVRMWLIFVSALYDVSKVTTRTSNDTGIYVRLRSDDTTSFTRIGDIKDCWKLREKFTSFEAAKGEVTRLADYVPIGEIHLVANVDLITDFLPRS